MSGLANGWLRVKLLVFRALEALSHVRRPPAPARVFGRKDEPETASSRKSLWVYVTTIGELNAIEPWLRALVKRMDSPPLRLLTNHPHYAEAYLEKFPDATVIAFDGDSGNAARLARQMPPCMLVIAEIPCHLHDAPCRFSFSTLQAVRDMGATVVLVNGWLYGDQPPSRMDRIENSLFARDYVKGIDLAMVQTDEVKEALARLGADPQKIHVTGNLKYDAMRIRAVTRPASQLVELLAQSGAYPLIVAGSITELSDQRALLHAFRMLFEVYPGARLILAPRHPENKSRLEDLRHELKSSGIGFQFKTETRLDSLMATPILILDTMGELSECYAAATFAYVGADHNLLEPLSYYKLTYTSGDWHPAYPSYPVYHHAVGNEFVHHEQSLSSLGEIWIDHMKKLDVLQDLQKDRVRKLLESEYGRVDSALALVESSLSL